MGCHTKNAIAKNDNKATQVLADRVESPLKPFARAADLSIKEAKNIVSNPYNHGVSNAKKVNRFLNNIHAEFGSVENFKAQHECAL